MNRQKDGQSQNFHFKHLIMSQKDDIKGKNYKISRIGQKLKTYFFIVFKQKR